ncbi:MAG TPA: GNAT family N-acetyltransferase [Bacteroidales bacterium]|jgi:hypothetical protein|nr:GNAT family N-acetyltransferase [Bacteroidales bacterium]OQC56781.1 MAG: hypothetical protein BWX52_01425 [Bacteroidetes bacterium ADurb.Bin013]MBP8998781.1 GNAT family N-acetyltransferase [Bacteroidales bacterium]MBV6456658.1 hypothetical protein [Bacteroidales bacterium]MCZ2316432.1 GNAT family N-acetyltransferase [Bacteroidales bacterium]
MEPIIPPVSIHLLEEELTRERFVRYSSRGENKLFDVNAHEAPNTMREIGRLREIAFRAAGGGTGYASDIDSYDVSPETPYRQLVVWDPKRKEILGGYRYIIGAGIRPQNLATYPIFSFSDNFVNNYLPFTIELGRSFVQPNYQNSNENRSGLYALDNLWDGLGALIVRYPHMKYFFGKVTMYRTYNKQARNCLLYFLNKYFPDPDSLATAIDPLDYNAEKPYYRNIFVAGNYDDDYKTLVREIRTYGERIPPLINSYMKISPNMRVFGTTLNEHFGGVEETGILITIKDMYPDRVGRHMNSLRHFAESVGLRWWNKDASKKAPEDQSGG